MSVVWTDPFLSNSVVYSYLENSPLVSQMLHKQGTTTRFTATRQYDYLNRLQFISAPGAAAFAYSYNAANQRVRSVLADGSYWLYTYDRLGQVVSGKRYWQDGTPVAGQQYEYGFDDIGNRTWTGSGGDANGGALRTASYTRNFLNQYESRTVPGVVDVLGIANPGADVKINGTYNAYRKGNYFHFPLTVANDSAAQYPAISVTSQYPPQASDSGHVFVPARQESFLCDEDGNLTRDGRWSYSWDGENRLVRMTANTTAGPQQRIDFRYDWQGRRIAKTVWDNVNGTGTPTLDQRFLYDGWNLLEVYSANLTPQMAFLWGLDLSGTPQGAGGVGGLLAVSQVSGGTVTASHFTAYDGNGNVAALVSATDGSPSARYEYGPFGEVLRATGSMAKANPFRFSTKYQDDETDLLYYGCRYYNASTGRWISRDLKQESGGRNLYAFVGNRTAGEVDPIGREPWPGYPGGVWGPGLSCSICRCKEVEVRYHPGGSRLELGFYTEPEVGRRFGNLITVRWRVDGDPNLCTYSQNESLTWADTTTPDGRTTRRSGTDGLVESDFPPLFPDSMGFTPTAPGFYDYFVHWDVTYKCVSSPESLGTKTQHDGPWDVSRHFVFPDDAVSGPRSPGFP